MSKDKVTLKKVIPAVLIFATVIGVVAGALTARGLTQEETDMLWDTLNLPGTGGSAPQVINTFKTAFFNNLFYIGLIFLGGLTVFLVPAVPLVVVFRGFSFGFSAGFLIKTLGIDGFWLSCVAALPQAILYLSVFVVFGAAASNRAVCAFVNRKNYAQKQSLTKPFLLSALISVFVILIGAAAEGVLSTISFSLAV